MSGKNFRAVLWDFGGVFTTSPFEAFNLYEAQNNLPDNFLRSINASNPDNNAWALLERSEITLDEFDKKFAAESRTRGHEVPGRDVIALLSGALRPEMVEALKKCRAAGLATGCITNNVRQNDDNAANVAHNNMGFNMGFVFDLFDHVIESSKVGLRKPDPKIYLMACDALNIEPHQAVYLDDLGINLKPARALGMTTIKVASADQALSELEKILNLALR